MTIPAAPKQLSSQELARMDAQNEDEGSLHPADTRRLIAEIERLWTHACSRTCQGRGECL